MDFSERFIIIYFLSFRNGCKIYIHIYMYIKLHAIGLTLIAPCAGMNSRFARRWKRARRWQNIIFTLQHALRRLLTSRSWIIYYKQLNAQTSLRAPLLLKPRKARLPLRWIVWEITFRKKRRRAHSHDVFDVLLRAQIPSLCSLEIRFSSLWPTSHALPIPSACASDVHVTRWL